MRITTDWKDIKGYEGVYQVHYNGSIRKILKNGYMPLSPTIRRRGNRKTYVIRLTDSNGKRKEYTMLKIMAENFIGPRPQGCVPYHINGMQNDNYYTNISYISCEELGRLNGYRGKGKNVVTVDRHGEIIDVYRSASDCASNSKTNKQTVADYCNGVNKKPFNNEYCFAWEEDIVSMRKAIKRLNSKPKPYNGKQCRKVYVFDKSGKLINEFHSIAEAARNMFYSYGFVSECCRDLKNCKEYRFSFIKKESDIDD